MYPDILKIPKTLKQVTLWVHPEGQVVGAVFVRTQSTVMAREEEPAEVLNQPDPFLILQLGQSEDQESVRFYNKASIVRMEYRDEQLLDLPEMVSLGCTLYLMDGSRFAGQIRKPDRARLFDYLNLTEERFVKIELGDGDICLVNKSYIVSVTP
jgi:hypothetical protein